MRFVCESCMVCEFSRSVFDAVRNFECGLCVRTAWCVSFHVRFLEW